jgi:hypothetical protein
MALELDRLLLSGLSKRWKNSKVYRNILTPILFGKVLNNRSPARFDLIFRNRFI